MSAKTIAYWTTTLIFAAFMAYNAYAYLSRDPKMMAAMFSLGYPPYFPIILGIAKILGVIAILVPSAPRTKEWAYAGFTFTMIGAFFPIWPPASSARRQCRSQCWSSWPLPTFCVLRCVAY